MMNKYDVGPCISIEKQKCPAGDVNQVTVNLSTDIQAIMLEKPKKTHTGLFKYINKNAWMRCVRGGFVTVHHTQKERFHVT